MKVIDESDSKFEREKLNQAAIFVIRTYRAGKIKLPETGYSTLILTQCDKIDPDHKMSERELVERLFNDPDICNVVQEAVETDTLVSDYVIKEYVDKYYVLLRAVLTSPDSGAYDAYEYQSQQLISILSVKKMDMFRQYIKEKMDSDPTCPFFIRKFFLDIMQLPKQNPTMYDEELAESIIKLTSPKLQDSNPEVFRALVDSMKWRGTLNLERTLLSVKKTSPENRHIRGRESCVFIETDDDVHYVG